MTLPYRMKTGRANVYLLSAPAKPGRMLRMKGHVMQLEDYFDVLAPDDIRIKGHRIGIETVLYEYIHNDKSAEEIQHRFQTLSLEEVYATVLYYLHNREQVGRYVAGWLDFSHQVRDDARRNPSPSAERILALRDEINAYPPAEREAVRLRIIERERARRKKVEAA